MSELKLIITGTDGVRWECAELGQTFTWSGDVRQCARTLDTALMPDTPCALGSRVQFSVDGTVRLDGYIFERQREMDAQADPLIGLACVDRGVYLKRNEGAYKFSALTPEAIARRVCADFGIQVGPLAETGVKVSRNFPGVSLYKIISTAYTLAAEQTGERYAIRFRGEALEVVVKKQGPSTPVIQPGSSLRGGNVAESVSDMVNQVAIYNESGVRVGVQKDEQAIQLYGLMQAYLKQSKGTDAVKEARAILEDNAIGRKVSVTVQGDPALVAGGCVVMREPVTGLYGLFWIDSDTHTWTKDGDYSTKLVLNFRNVMDEQEAGSPPK